MTGFRAAGHRWPLWRGDGAIERPLPEEDALEAASLRARVPTRLLEAAY